MDTLSLVKEISDIKQFYTQYAGARPFGVSIIFAGVEDHSPVLLVTDPTGIYFEYKATAIGEAEAEVKGILNKEYRENMTIEEGLKVAVNALKKVLGKDFDIKRLDGAYIKLDSKKFRKIDRRKFKV